MALGVLRPDYHLPSTAACLVEVSFLDRADEEQRLADESYRNQIADGIADGILTYLGVSLQPTASLDVGDSIEVSAIEENLSVEMLAGVDGSAAVPNPSETSQREGEDENSSPGRSPFSTSFLSGAEPDNAIRVATSGWADRADFDRFIEDLGLRFFTPAEFLFLGAGNDSGRCQGLNTFPPRELWPNIVNTARFLDAIRAEMNSPIRITSCYRSPDYNRCVSGAASSQHVQFNAIDFVCSAGTPEVWRRVAAGLRDRHREFRGGIGRYPSFVHIDTRGTNANW